jgi:hypothetical protein
MTKILRRSLWALGIIAVVVLAFGLIFDKVGERLMCGNEVIQTLPSQDQHHSAVLFERDCGATTGFSTQISVISSESSLPNEAGNVFIADLRGPGPTGSWHGPIARMRWVDNRMLEIHYDHTARSFVKKDRIGSVEVRYLID